MMAMSLKPANPSTEQGQGGKVSLGRVALLGSAAARGRRIQEDSDDGAAAEEGT